MPLYDPCDRQLHRKSANPPTKVTQDKSTFFKLYLVEHSPRFQITEKAKAVGENILLENIMCYIVGVGTAECFYTLMQAFQVILLGHRQLSAVGSQLVQYWGRLKKQNGRMRKKEAVTQQQPISKNSRFWQGPNEPASLRNSRKVPKEPSSELSSPLRLSSRMRFYYILLYIIIDRQGYAAAPASLSYELYTPHNLKNAAFSDHYHHLLFLSCYSFSLFCWKCSMAMDPVVLVRFGACPSKITRYSSPAPYYSRVILFQTAPKMSGLLMERDSRFARMSTSYPTCVEPCWVFLFWLRQVLRCLFISDARMTCLHAWQCCTMSLFLASPIILSSCEGFKFCWCCWIRANSSPPAILLVSVSKVMVSTNQKSFQSMLLYFTCFAACSFFPRSCCCFAKWYSQTKRHAEKIASRSVRHFYKRYTSDTCISKMAVYAYINRVKQRWLFDEGRKNSNCGLFFSRSDKANRKLRPLRAAYWAVCWIIACSPSPNFSGSSATYFSGSGSFSSSKIFSRKLPCPFCSTCFTADTASTFASSLGYSLASPWIIFLLISATRWSQQARQGLSGLRNANQGLCCSRSMRIFSNSDPLSATCQAVFSSSSEWEFRYFLFPRGE